MHIYVFIATLKKGFKRGYGQTYRTTVRAKNAREAVKLGKENFRQTFNANPFNAEATKRIAEWMPMPLPNEYEWQPLRGCWVGNVWQYTLAD